MSSEGARRSPFVGSYRMQSQRLRLLPRSRRTAGPRRDTDAAMPAPALAASLSRPIDVEMQFLLNNATNDIWKIHTTCLGY